MINNIYDQLMRDEGLSLSPYADTRGFITIGYGHNVTANPLPNYDLDNFTIDAAEQVLRDDCARIWAKLYRDMPWLSSIDSVRQGVYQNMSFNLGAGGVEEFHHSLDDVQAGNYAQAALDMQQSAWYTQVGARARRLCIQMKTGIWQ